MNRFLVLLVQITNYCSYYFVLSTLVSLYLLKGTVACSAQGQGFNGHNFRFAGFQRASMLVNCMEHSWRRHRGKAFTDEQHLPRPRIELTLRH